MIWNPRKNILLIFAVDWAFFLSFYNRYIPTNATNYYPCFGKMLMCHPSSRNLIKPIPIKQSIKSSDCSFVRSFSELLTKMYFSSWHSNSSSSSLVSLYVWNKGFLNNFCHLARNRVCKNSTEESIIYISKKWNNYTWYNIVI